MANTARRNVGCVCTTDRPTDRQTVKEKTHSILADGVARAWLADGGGRRILNGTGSGAGIGGCGGCGGCDGDVMDRAIVRNRPMCNGREPKQNIMRIRSSRLATASGCFFLYLLFFIFAFFCGSVLNKTLRLATLPIQYVWPKQMCECRLSCDPDIYFSMSHSHV